MAIFGGRKNIRNELKNTHNCRTFPDESVSLFVKTNRPKT